jgi:Animal haem peroxidase
MRNMIYSFGLMNPGAVTLHNYPKALQHFDRPDGIRMDLAAHDVFRVRELGVPRYTQFRKLLNLKPVRTFEELTDNPVWREEIRRVYNNDIDRVDLIVGLFAEKPPKGFGFSDTAFRVFVLMASRRLNSDRFFTTDYNEEVYSKVGMAWVNDNTMSTVLLRHFPELAASLRGVENAFAPWKAVGSA